MYYYEDCERQALEEASYWFCVQEVADYVEMFGMKRVMYDIMKQLDKDNQVRHNVNSDQLEDVPF